MRADPDDDRLEQIGYQLMGQGVYLREIESTADPLRIEYETLAPGDGVPHQQVGQVITTFRNAIEEGWTITTIEATVTDGDGDLRGTWRMDEAWLRALEAGELSEVAFSQRVLDTIDEAER